MTDDQIIDRIITVEGGFVNDRYDRGHATKFGITAATLGAWRGYGAPASVEEVRQLSVHEAREIFRQQYIVKPGFSQIQDDALRAQLVDDAVLSGPRAAIVSLQAAVGVRPDGLLGPITVAAANAAASPALQRDLAIARALRLARLVQQDPGQSRFIVGWIDRALGFLRAA